MQDALELRLYEPGRAAAPMTQLPQTRTRVFAYGSNMLAARLRERVPSAKAIGIGRLPNCVLRWHKRGRDGSGKCDLERTRRKEDGVWGVIYELDAADKPALDQAEGLGKGYVERRVDVVTSHGIVRALAYVATARDLRLRPYHWYKAFVIAGALEHGLPKDYVEHLETTPSNRDPDDARAAKNENLLEACQLPRPR